MMDTQDWNHVGRLFGALFYALLNAVGPEAAAVACDTQHGNARPDGAQKVMTSQKDPGTIRDGGKGAAGADVPDNRNRPDEGVRH